MRKSWLLLSTGIVYFLVGCGGGGGGSSSSGGGTQTQNSAPVWTSAPPSSAKEGHIYTYLMAGQDANSDPLTYSLVSGPAGASISGSTLNWTPTGAQIGVSQSFKARVSDGKGGAADQDWSLIPAPNAAPAFTTTPASNAKEGRVYVFASSVSDADGDPVNVVAISLPAGATFANGSVTWTPASAQVGNPQTFTLRATDGFGGSKDLTWSVTPSANASPSFTTTPSLVAKEGHPYTYTPGITDADGDTVNVTAVSLPAGATFNGGQISWTPGSTQIGIAQTFTLRATDGFGGQKDQTWSVMAVANASPSFTTTPSLVAKEGHPYTYASGTSDTDGDTVNVTAVTLPAGATFNGGQISWIPGSTQVGIAQTFTLRATDGFGGQKDQTWSVMAVANAMPVFTTTPQPLGAVGTPYSYSPAASDADGDAVSFALVSAPTGATLTNGTIQWLPQSAQAGAPQVFLLRASDGFGKTADQTWTIYLRASNAPPVISSTPPTTGTFYYSYTIQAADPDGDALTYSLDVAPTGASLSTSPGVIIGWNPSSSQERVPSAFTLKVTDALGASTTQSWSVTPTGTIRGTRILNSVTDAGDVPKPDDMSTWALGTLAAWVPNATGGFDMIYGSGLADGTFTIPGVPAGYYWFKSGNNYFWTNSSTMDLGYDYGGRADAVAATSASTQLGFTVTGLNAWQSADDLQWTVSNTGYWNSLLAGATTTPAIGDTALSNLTVPWQWSYLNDASKGDQGYLTQLTTRTSGGENYQALAKVFAPAPFTQVDGGSYTVTGAFQDVPQTGTVRVNIARSQFSQFQTQVHPTATMANFFMALDAQPGGLTRGWLSATPDLLTWYPPPAATDIDLGDLAFGNPFPSTWSKFLAVDYAFRVNYLLPGATTAYPASGEIYVVTDQLPTATSPLRPSIGPVQSPLINGLNFHTDHSGVGLSPVISWSAPSTGTPTGFMVTVYRLYISGTATARTTVAILRTKTNSITLPPGLLQSGASYCMQISAYSQPGVDFATGPYRRRIPYGFAKVLSGVFVP